jgi:hypothetical protein
MDPNANLAEQDRIVTRRQAAGMLNRQDAARLRELRQALAAWLAGGGFPPDWRQAPRAARYYSALA